MQERTPGSQPHLFRLLRLGRHCFVVARFAGRRSPLALQFDHILAHVMGGRAAPGNVQALPWAMNRVKGGLEKEGS